MIASANISDQATPFLNRLGDRVRSGALENAMGRGANNAVRNHLFRVNRERPNQLGGRRTNFYAGAARATSYTSRPGLIEVNVNQVGIRQRVEGGVIKAVKGKYLTIPAVPEAHGRTAREFSNLRFGFAENKYGNLQPALVRASASQVSFGRKKRDGSRSVKRTGSAGGEVVYWLTPRVFQRADPTVMPAEAEIIKAATDTGDAYLRTVERGGAS